MAAHIVFRPPGAQWRDGSETSVGYVSMEAASAAFAALHQDYPEVVVLCGVPRPHWRRGPKGDISLQSDDGRDIGVSRDGGYYREAGLLSGKYLRGAGYMGKMVEQQHPSDCIDEIPSDSVRADYPIYSDSESVSIGNLVVAQKELDRVVRATGHLPGHVHKMDYSGSVMVVSVIDWGPDIPEMAGIPAPGVA